MQESQSPPRSGRTRGMVAWAGLVLGVGTFAWCSVDAPPYVPPGPACVTGGGVPPSDCALYEAEASWLPEAYVSNATCACQALPDEPTSNCVRAHLQASTRETSWGFRRTAAAMEGLRTTAPPVYELWLDEVFTPRIYAQHQEAYASCCCPSGPAPFVDWLGVTNVALPTCAMVGEAIALFGSCHGTPGRW